MIWVAAAHNLPQASPCTTTDSLVEYGREEGGGCRLHEPDSLKYRNLVQEAARGISFNKKIKQIN